MINKIVDKERVMKNLVVLHAMINEFLVSWNSSIVKDCTIHEKLLENLSHRKVRCKWILLHFFNDFK